MANSDGAGTIDAPSFVKSLFHGVITPEALVPYPRMSDAESRRVHELCDRIQELATSGKVDSAAIDERCEVPATALRALAELGLFGAWSSSEHGGLGLTTLAAARVLQELGSLDASLGLLVLAHVVGGVRALTLFGTPAQRSRWLPLLARGELTAAFAFAEESGSDPAGVRTRARRSADGSWNLSGGKPWVTGAEGAGVFLVLARTTELDEAEKPKLTTFLVERSAVRLGRRKNTMGVRGVAIHEVFFDEVTLPADALIGEVGRGYRVAQTVIADGRIVQSALMVGQARAVLNHVLVELRTRRCFGRAIGEFPLLQDKVARMIADVYAVETMTYLTAGLVDRGVADYAVESAICRIAASEALWRVVGEAQQAVAAVGFSSGTVVERAQRDARAGFVFDATNETLRAFVALAGMRSPAARLQSVSQAMSEPVKGFGLLRDFALRKVRERFLRERLEGVHPELGREVAAFEESVESFAQAIDRVLRDQGTEIAEMQYTQLRVANTAIDLYALAAILARASGVVTARGESGSRRELRVANMFSAAAERRVRANLTGLGRNDDELRREIASRLYDDGRYPFDVS